jgi:hypothetical protein
MLSIVTVKWTSYDPYTTQTQPRFSLPSARIEVRESECRKLPIPISKWLITSVSTGRPHIPSGQRQLRLPRHSCSRSWQSRQPGADTRPHSGPASSRALWSKDPLIGTQDPAESIFVIPQANGEPPIEVKGLSTFVTTKAAAYLFLPSITAIKFIASLGEGP